jgi:sugar phosphate isomerase/epimerase
MPVKLGVFTVALENRELADALRWLKQQAIRTIELSTRNRPGNCHVKLDRLLESKSALHDFINLMHEYEIEISALSCHVNHLHPQREIARAAQEEFRQTVLLAEKLGITRVITFSGCPGDSPGSNYPNWVTCPWPEDFLKILDYQWNEVLVPYWEQTTRFAFEHGVDRVCLEMHPGFCVYNPETLLRLRAAAGPVIGANCDPSHLFWQGINPVAAIRKLGAAIYYFHAKDTALDQANTAINGVLDTKSYGNLPDRSWVFRTVGYGHGAEVWKDIISALRMAGYDDVVSIEHEDSLMTREEGLQKAISFLKEIIIGNQAEDAWWI